jgi:AcrR family transcriptional regulator
MSDALEHRDGRHRRSEASRAAVVDALLGLYDDGVLQPGAGEIAARAGVSERSVFRHFDDLESLAEAAIERQWSRIAPYYEPPARDGAVGDRIGGLVRQRIALHNAAAPVARAGALLAPRSPIVRRTLAARRSVLRRQVAELFAAELDAASDHAVLLAALDAAASFEQVEYLRATSGLSAARAAAVMTRMLTALLEGTP